MIRLLIHVPDIKEMATSETAFGGRPSASQGVLDWPICSSCKGNMQFLGQLRPDESERLFLLFMCQNEPGMCDEWDPNGGGNKVLSIAVNGLKLVQPPHQGEVLRSTRYGAKIVEQLDADYDSARSAWVTSNSASTREVLGQMGGNPAWIQSEEIPVCHSCGKPLQFVAQLEQGPNWQAEMNFGGGGCAYIFSCTCNHENSKLLWQC